MSEGDPCGKVDGKESRMEVEGNLIDPIYSQSVPSEPIDLGQCEIEFSYKAKTWNDLCRVRLQFSPSTRLLFLAQDRNRCPSLYFSLFTDREWDGKVTFKDRDVSFAALFTGDHEAAAGAFIPRDSFIRVTPPTNDIHSVIFHLFNWPHFVGAQDYTSVTQSESQIDLHRCGRILLTADGWKVTIAAIRQTSDHCRALTIQGGMIITHVGRIVREDGSPFSSAALQELLECLHYFLSFGLGRWTGPSLPVGFDRGKNRIFEQWGLTRVAAGSWIGSSSWFDHHHAELLAQVFPGFVAIWRNDLWRKPIANAIYWYVSQTKGHPQLS